MLVDTNLAIAFRSIYGNYNINEFALFDLIKIKHIEDGLELSTSKRKEITLSVRCPLCGKNHFYKYSTKDVVSKGILIAGCEELGEPILYIGKCFKVKERISRYESLNTEIFAMI